MSLIKLVVRAPFAYNGDLVSEETGLRCEDETYAVQSEKEEVDINTLVKRFGITGTMPMLDRLPSTADFHEVFDYQTAMNQIRAAEESFMQLPAEVRERFNNDPGRFVDFCSDEGNLPELRRMKLAPEAEPVAEPPKAAPVPSVS